MPILFWVVLAIWLIGIGFGWIYGARAVPIIVLLAGILGILGVTALGMNVWIGVGVLAVGSAVIWIVNTTGLVG
jgi:hypothetical protein